MNTECAMKCDLCGVDNALKNGVLCAACREAIVRLLVTDERQQAPQSEADTALSKATVHPEKTQSTRKAGS